MEHLEDAPLKGRLPAHTRKRYTRLERLARDKHSSLLRTLINYGRKKFYNIGPRANVIRHFR
jgi:hypothetical protein